jgi:hypothetical protein
MGWFGSQDRLAGASKGWLAHGHQREREHEGNRHAPDGASAQERFHDEGQCRFHDHTQ